MSSNETSGHKPFDEDALEHQGYLYTLKRAPFSAQIATARQSKLIHDFIPSGSKSLLDVGCGDGAFTSEFADMGLKKIVGIDPSTEAIKIAKSTDTFGIEYHAGGIELVRGAKFDIGILRGVLHHANNPRELLFKTAEVCKRIIVLEPNGLNPILKVIEKTSPYHRSHGEKSFHPKLLRAWIRGAGYIVVEERVGGLVPYFSPAWAARILSSAEPIAERMPWIRDIICGSIVLVAQSPDLNPTTK